MKAFYGLEKGPKARDEGTALTVGNVSTAITRLSEKAGKSFPPS